ncbi:class I SAM-dependent methyltransferase [Haloarcula mannanilytica]|uniref:class I SAM-dependent methyltransferase n=1 Tax=Haloarcula mannanilytica TaxID=2509225 RepID=UPI001357470E|nr:class I SAM-dependent methyltransferase [Haloarcula mannanilytica]
MHRDFNTTNSFETLTDVLRTDIQSLRTYIDEFSSEVKPRVDDCRTEFETKPFEIGGIEVEAPILYASIRIFQPERVVEVGVANGVSSYYILSALAANDNAGTLTSIDLPKYEDDHTGEWDADAGAWIPSGRDVGWIVPDEYRDKWEIQIGSMSDLLPNELYSGSVDAFVYDGPKRYSERKRTFDMVANSAGNCLYFCDDIAWNPSFERWADQNRLRWDTFGNAGLAVDGEL